MKSLRQTPFWYLRHGQTDWNAQNLAQGAVDIPLNAEGLRQAEVAAGRLHGRGVTAIFSSPLERARVTAGVVSKVIGLPVTVVPDLHEVAFGVMEGKPMFEGDWFQRWNTAQSTPDQAESFEALRSRAVLTLNAVLETVPGPVLFVGHGAFFRALRAAMGLDPTNRLPNATPIFCQPPAEAGPPWRLEPMESEI
jgi:probable phosphoglycerate mutase